MKEQMMLRLRGNKVISGRASSQTYQPRFSKPLNTNKLSFCCERKGEPKVILLGQKLQMAKAKIKPLLPSLREKKRYLAFEVISRYRFNDAVNVSKAISDAANDFLGDFGMAKAGILPLNDKWNENMQRGIMRVNNKHVDDLKASLIFVKNIEGKGAIVKSVGASGILRKAQQKYLNQAG